MSSLRRNILFNFGGTGINVVLGFFLAPFLINKLGDNSYGIWILLGSLSGYSGLLDLGVRAAVGRYTAYYLAKNDQGKLRQTTSTAAFLLIILASVAALLLASMSFVFCQLFSVPQVECTEATIALLVVAVTLWLLFVGNFFDGLLWGCQRFDLINIVDAPLVILRTVITFWLVSQGGGLLTLAIISFAYTASIIPLKMSLALRQNKHLLPLPSFVRKNSINELISYGVWNFLNSLTASGFRQLTPVIVGLTISVGAITPFNISMRLVSYATLAIVTVAGVLTPLFTSFMAVNEWGKIRKLYYKVTCYCTCLSLYFCGGLILFGETFIGLWIGESHSYANKYLIILALGHLIPMAQLPSSSLILAMNRQKYLAIFNTIGLILFLGATYFTVDSFGLTGLSWSHSISSTIFLGILPGLLCLKLLEINIVNLLLKVALFPIIFSIISYLMARFLIQHINPSTWLELISLGVVYSIVFALPAILFIRRERF